MNENPHGKLEWKHPAEPYWLSIAGCVAPVVLILLMFNYEPAIETSLVVHGVRKNGVNRIEAIMTIENNGLREFMHHPIPEGSFPGKLFVRTSKSVSELVDSRYSGAFAMAAIGPPTESLAPGGVLTFSIYMYQLDESGHLSKDRPSWDELKSGSEDLSFTCTPIFWNGKTYLSEATTIRPSSAIRSVAIEGL